MRKEVFAHIAIFLLAGFIRLYFITHFQAPPQNDALNYDELAMRIVKGEAYTQPGDCYSKPPGQPLFLAFIYFIFGRNYFIARVFQAVLGALLCNMIYIIAREIFDNRGIGLSSGLYAVFYLPFIKVTETFLAEGLFVFFFALAVLYLVRIKGQPTVKNLTLTGLFLSFATLTKGISALFPLLVCGLLASKGYLEKGETMTRGKLARYIVVFCVAFILPFIPWIIRNYRVYHAFVPVSTQGGYLLYSSYQPPGGKIFGVDARDENVRYAYSLNSEVKMSNYLVKKTLEFIKDNPGKALRLEVLKVGYFWSPFDWELIKVGKGVYNFQYGFLLPFFGLGCFLIMKRALKRAAPLLLCIIGYFQAMCLVFQGSPRYRLPVEPFIMILSFAAICWLVERAKRKGLAAIFLVGIFFLNYIGFVYSDLVKLTARGLFVKLGIW